MQRRQVTLKEKLQDHYQNRNFTIKKTQASSVGMAIFGGMWITLLIEGLFVLLPAYFTEEDGSVRTGYRFAQITALWLFVITGINWYRVYFDVLNRVTKETKDAHFPNMGQTPPGWKNCPTCMVDAPPRSHHCPMCNHCILRRDHHCFFTGSCVGYHNQRYFLIFCLYTTLSTAYGSYMQLAYLNEEFPIFSNAAIFYFPLTALWQYLTGVTSFTYLFILIHVYANITILGFAAMSLVWQIFIAIRGQTSYEAWKHIMVFRRRSIIDNICSTLGNPLDFLLCLVVPITLKMPEDGAKWVIEPKSEKGH